MFWYATFIGWEKMIMGYGENMLLLWQISVFEVPQCLALHQNYSEYWINEEIQLYYYFYLALYNFFQFGGLDLRACLAACSSWAIVLPMNALEVLEYTASCEGRGGRRRIKIVKQHFAIYVVPPERLGGLRRACGRLLSLPAVMPATHKIALPAV